MSPDELLAAFALPATCRVDRRVPKTLLIEHGAFAAGDRKTITEGADDLSWVAACKPGNLGVPVFRDAEREYLEIAVLVLRPRGDLTDADRLSSLVHRAIPYPVVLITALQDGVALSLAHKRQSRGEKDRVVLDGDLVSLAWDLGEQLDDQQRLAFAPAVRASLFALYQQWVDAALSFQAWRITGRFSLPVTADAAALRRQALNARADLLARVGRLTAEAEHESQMARLVALNEEIRQLRARLIEEESRL